MSYYMMLGRIVILLNKNNFLSESKFLRMLNLFSGKLDVGTPQAFTSSCELGLWHQLP